MSTVRVTELQFQDYGANSHKFYRLYEGAGWSVIHYGRIGAKGSFQAVTGTVGRTRLREKLAKGYDATSEVDFEWQSGTRPAGEYDFGQLAREANKAIGGNVNVSPTTPKSQSATEPYKSPEQRRHDAQDAEAAQMKATLLAMRSKLNPTATVTPEPAPIAATIVDKLGAALAAAKAKAGAKA